jgi:hypothetical protein
VTELPAWLQVLIEVELSLLACGVIVGLIVFVVVALRTILDHHSLVSPADFKEERAAIEADKHHAELDEAWPWYFRRQVHADGQRMEAEGRGTYVQLWRALGAPLFTRAPRTGALQPTGAWLLVPYPVAVLPFLAGTLAGLLAGAALYLSVELVVLALAWCVFGVLVGILRGAEAAWLRLHRSSATCHYCHHVGDRPAYRCSRCAAVHRDIRPGRLGVFQRRCACGELMPTMVLRAAWSQQAVCQRCGEPLPAGSAATRDIRVAIFGDVAAGKTRLLYAALDSLATAAAANSLAIDYPDDRSRALAGTALATIRADAETAKTGLAAANALSFRLGTGANSTLVHVFDVAGELYRDGERYDDVSFLDNGHGLIFVVDPLTVREKSDLAYGQVVGRLRDRGVKKESQRLAVVVSKVDLLAERGVDFPAESAAIAEWLSENGLHNVVIAAENEFAAVSYFAVASVAAERSTPGTDPGAPLRWLLWARGVALPAEPQPVAIGEVADE